MILRKGMSTPDVLNLETVLQALGFEGFTVDGIFDEKTENVVKYIQKTNHLKVDGVVGDKTFTIIDDLYQPTVVNFAHLKSLTPEQVKTEIETKPTEKLASVNPRLALKVQQVIELAKQEGYTLTPVQTLRTFAEQDKLYKQRPRVTKAKGGQSYHNYGLAVDLAFVVNGKISWEEKLYKNIGRWASQIGLTWGGTWKFVDYPHVQLLNLPATGKLLVVYNMAGGGDKGVRAVWNKFVG